MQRHDQLLRFLALCWSFILVLEFFNHQLYLYEETFEQGNKDAI